MYSQQNLFVSIILLIAVSSGFDHTADAQTYGFRLGPNFVNQRLRDGAQIVKPGATVRFHAGVFINSEIDKNFCVQIEIGYSGLGHQQNPYNNPGSGKYEYGTAGIVLKYYPNQKLSILAGPQLGYLLGGKTSAGQNVADLPPDRDDLNAVIGAEFYPVRLLGVGLRYNLGLSNIKTISIDRQYNRAIQLSLILRIPGYQLKESGY
ncbi:MAG: PorT family protein [Cytophagales bacterium]|jgi:hypothetical protein|nr:PorT family protein [Cytophagales bacterium]